MLSYSSPSLNFLIICGKNIPASPSININNFIKTLTGKYCEKIS